MAYNSMYQTAQQVHLNLFPPKYFVLLIADRGGGAPYFFLNRELLLI